MLRPIQLACLFVIVLGPILCCSQTESTPVVTFTFDFPGSEPEHYSLSVSSNGAARYESSGRLSSDSDSEQTDSFDFDFTLGAETRQRIFELAAKAGYFQKDLDSRHKGLAFTGKKTLRYKDAQKSGESTYNYSSSPAVQELTNLLQSLAATLEHGHRLQYDFRYQKLALDEELKRMEELARGNQLRDIAAIRPILDEIIADQSVINVTRARAQRMLERAGGN